ncbi:ABC transporter permease [Erysipelotrichaceae bacterium MTC7]|nr:ABC transporter permease [Erysipelotrichaceae bacterium MTC7]
MNQKMKAIIAKDIRSIVGEKRYFTMLLFLPFFLGILFPSIFVLLIKVAPTDMHDLDGLMQLLPKDLAGDSVLDALLSLILNQTIPIFFMLIPIMCASVMAASSFVGEKEKRTLETLLYSPLSLRDIFKAKVLASTIISLLITYATFILMVLILNVEFQLLDGTFFIPGLSWLWVMVLLVPACTLLAITFIVKGSAKSKSMEEAQQKAAFLVMPILLAFISQFMGFVIISPFMILIAGVILFIIGYLMLQKTTNAFTYETLIK